MYIIADLHLHSKYSRAVSQQMVFDQMWEWGKKKGIDVLATGDWTHPLWFREIKTHLEEMGNGLLKLKTDTNTEGPFFMLSTEISSIYSKGGKGRRIHTLFWLPSIASAEKINTAMTKRGANLMSDGRPIVGLSSEDLADLVLQIDPKTIIVPAHVWTPWFSLYGSKSGFDSVEECFGKFANHIYAVETGLSSNPTMNWQIPDLDRRAILSFSDAHSGPKLGREATVFEMPALSYDGIGKALTRRWKYGNDIPSNKSDPHIAYTIEFYPEEGKYHYTGHRVCGVRQDPTETKTKGTTCPVCGKPLTVGVMHRVEDLAGRSEKELDIEKRTIAGVDSRMYGSKQFSDRPPFTMLIPLYEILAESMETNTYSPKVIAVYEKLVSDCGGEFAVLMQTSLDKITAASNIKVADGIKRVRRGDIVIEPGYDGVFGVVKIWPKEKKESGEGSKSTIDAAVPDPNNKEQLSLF